MIRPGFLSAEQRASLEGVVRRTSGSHGVARRANALLLLDGCNGSPPGIPGGAKSMSSWTMHAITMPARSRPGWPATAAGSAGLFARTPAQERHVPGFNVEPGKAYAMRCEIGPTSTTYWITNQKYAAATYEPKDVPAAGRIGFAVYGRTDVQVDQILFSSG